MKKLGMSAALAAIGVLLSGSFSTQANNNNNDENAVRFSARLSTFNEVPPKANGASGSFRAKLSEDGTTLSWTFTWSGLSGPPLFAHIHFGLKGANYPVMTFFCGGPKANPDIPQKPDCPQTTSGSITGTTTAADIIPLNTPNTPTTSTDQALDLHDFAGFLHALEAGSAYANMHTSRFQGGEIRGQIAAHRGDRDDE
jgi:CHRD domain-containing protein